MASIGEEIKQKKFRNEYSELFINVLYTSSWLSAHQNQFFKEYGLTSQQYNVLRILRGQGESAASVNLIKDRMIDKMSNVSRIIDKLKTKQLVTRKASKHDRRQVDIKITERGLALLAELDTKMAKWEEGLHNITPEEAKAASKLLDAWRG
ncbi:MAG: MarR family transcriptional regulator [Salibacteraceae bacterium]